MLDGFIIEELKRRERERVERQRPMLEVPQHGEGDEEDDERRRSEKSEAPQRGVIVIDL